MNTYQMASKTRVTKARVYKRLLSVRSNEVMVRV